jgi:ribonuclease HI
MSRKSDTYIGKTHNILINCDAGCKQNRTGIGYEIIEGDKTVIEGAIRVKYTDINTAEHLAALISVKQAADYDTSTALLTTDSECVLNSICGNSSQSDFIKFISDKIVDNLNRFDSWRVRTAEREQTRRPDRLARHAYENYGVTDITSNW